MALLDDAFTTHHLVDDVGESLAVGLFDAAFDALSALDDQSQIRLIGRWVRRLEAARLSAAARLGQGSARGAATALSDADRSDRSIKRDARRAAAMAANPLLADRVTDGAIAPETIDALTKAVDDEGSIPGELIAAVAGSSPDQSRRIVKRHLEDATTAAEAEERHARQNQARRVRRSTTVDDRGTELAMLAIEGPDAVIDEMYQLLNMDADAAYRAAGGRDTPAGDHTSWQHRLFDAAIARLSGRRSTSSPSAKPSVVITVPLPRFDTADEATPAASVQVGTGAVADTYVADLLGQAGLSVILTDAGGEPLWFGRARRYATVWQYLALVVRDRGCVLCGAHHGRCQTHHIIPWEAPARGRTDLNNLALLCGPCHRRLHDRRQTLVWRRGDDHRRIWSVRPATAAELPPPRPLQRE